MEWEIENIRYFGKEITGPELDMGFVFREIHRRPADLKPVERIDTTLREEGNEA